MTGLLPGPDTMTPSCEYTDWQMGQRLERAGSVRSKFVTPCSPSLRRWLRDASVVVSWARRDHGMFASSWASRRMEAISADSAISVSLDKSSKSSLSEGEGCLEIASVAWLLVPCRCAIRKRHGRVRCLRQNRHEFDISSSVRSPKISTSGLWLVTKTRSSHPCVK